MLPVAIPSTIIEALFTDKLPVVFKLPVTVIDLLAFIFKFPATVKFVIAIFSRFKFAVFPVSINTLSILVGSLFKLQFVVKDQSPEVAINSLVTGSVLMVISVSFL